MWLIAALAASFAVRNELDEVFDSSLKETAQRLLYLAATEVSDDVREPAAGLKAALGEEDEYLTYVVRDREGHVLLQSHDADISAFLEKPSLGFKNTPTYRIYGEAIADRSLFIEIAEPLAERREATIEAAFSLFLPLVVLIPLSLAGVWWFVRHSMKPMVEFRAQIEARGGGDMSPVAADNLPNEFGPVAGAVNSLLDRLRRALEAERSFTSNSAHELRTPIAAALAQTQRLIAETRDEPTRIRAQHIEATLHRLTRLSEKLMQLARAEGGGLLSETPQDLGLVLPHVIEEFRHGGDCGRRLRLTNEGDHALVSHMDADAFAILMRNLVENALKHGPSGSPVEVLVRDAGVICVRNGGPVVPPETLARLKGRFERAGVGAAGAGLGLAIADVIAAGAGASLQLNSPASGRVDGFEAVLRLPMAD